MDIVSENIQRISPDGLGGVKTFYLFEWNKYNRSQIVLENQKLVSFPATRIYKVDVQGVSFTENSSFEGGAESWEQNFTFDVPKTNVGSQLFTLLRKNYRLIYTDNLGNTRILGLYNGLESKITNESATDKSGFNGYKVQMDGLEVNQAYWIDDLAAVGFTVDENPNNFVLQNDNNFILQDNNNFIFQ